MKKSILAGFVSLALVFALSPALTFAETVTTATPATSISPQDQITALLAEIKALQAQLLNLQGQGSEQSNCVNLSNNLTLGSSGSDVSSLQTYLIHGGVLDSQYNTGYYGFITAQAVGKMQMNLNVVSSANDSAYGITGPKTRAVLSCKGIEPIGAPVTVITRDPIVDPAPQPVTTSPLSVMCEGRPYNSGTPGVSWHANVSGGAGGYTYQWTMGNDVAGHGEGSTQASSFMVTYGSAGSKQASVVVSDGHTSTTASCSVVIPAYASAGTTPVTGNASLINSFNSALTTSNTGQRLITFTWDSSTPSAGGCWIWGLASGRQFDVNDGARLSSSGSLAYTPTQTATYRLYCASSAGEGAAQNDSRDTSVTI